MFAIQSRQPAEHGRLLKGFLLPVAALCVGLLGCGAKVKPGLEVSVFVEGGNVAGERVRRIELVFNRPMVDDARIGQIDAQSPFVLVPKVPGSVRWREDRKLVFEPQEPLPRSTRFTVTVARGTRAKDGSGLVQTFAHEFETERLTVRASFRREAQTPDPMRWAAPNQTLWLELNQPAKRKAIEKHCGFSRRDESGATGERIGITATPLRGPEAEQDDSFRVAPISELRAGSAYWFSCASELSGAEGPLGLAARDGAPPDFEHAYGAAPDGLLGFRTYGPFTFLETEPAGNEVDPDTSMLIVRMSNPVRPFEDGAAPKMALVPAPRDLMGPYVHENELVWHVAGLEPKTEYRIEIEADLQDVFGQRLRAPLAASFRTGAVKPGFDLESGSWTVESARGAYVGWVRNVPELEVTAAALSPADLFKVLPKLDWWDGQAIDLAALGIRAHTTRIVPEGPENHWNQVSFEPESLLGLGKGGSKTGSKEASSPRFVYLAARAPGVKRWDEEQGYVEVLLNLTNLGLNAKLSANSGLLWVTRLSDGAPQPGAEVFVQSRQGRVLWRGRTGDDGIARLPGKVALLGKEPPAPGRVVGDEGEERDEDTIEDEWRYTADLLVFARVGDDMTFVDPDLAGGFAGWNFSIPVRTFTKEEALRGFLHTDRGLYRPGETVHLHGLARLMRLGQGLRVPTKAKVMVKVRDPRNRVVKSESLAVSRYGGFHFDFTLDEAAALGDYQVEATLPEGAFSTSFSVEEFRPATFETKLGSEQTAAFAGEVLNVTATSTYFYGAPVRNADLRFRVHARPRTMSFAEFPSFSFSDEQEERQSGYRAQESLLTEEAMKLDGEGKARFEIPLSPEVLLGPATVLVSATVQDETNQTVAANLSVPVHRSRYYLGIDTGGWMVEAKKPHPLRVVAVNTKGNAIAAKVRLQIIRERWNCVWERWGYTGSTRCDRKEEIVRDERVEVGKEGPFAFDATFAEPGEYRVVAQGQDARGNTVRASSKLWVWGHGDHPWRTDDTQRFELVADKKSYRAGETARLLVKTQLSGARALFTIERDGILEHRVLDDLYDGQTFEVPISASYAPNVYVSLMLVRGRAGAGARGLPRATMGMINLPVEVEGKTLQVEVKTDRADYRPGDKVAASVRVTDAAGKPVQAEIALSAADEGVLSLIAYKTPDPVTTFFAPWELGVTTASQYTRLAQVPEPGEERYATGGDSAGRPGTLRARFRASAYWNPALVTDAEGRAEVVFDAPDNLTAFRLMAVAADAGDRFGSGERRFVVNKPLQLLSALPRFALVGDRFEAAVLVSNETGAAGEVEVMLDTKVLGEGVVPEGPAVVKAAIGKGQRARVAFPVAITGVGRARFRITARMGSERDGIELTIPLKHAGALESELISAGHTDGSVKLPVVLPAGILAGTGRIELSLDPDGLAGIENSLRDLIQYPYGCLEQTTSRLIPLVAVSELVRGLQLDELDAESVQRFVRAAVSKIYAFQADNGGFALWQGGVPEQYLTAYALWGLELARRAGYAVDRERIEQAVSFLRASLQEAPRSDGHYSLGGELGDRAFVLYVLGLVGRPEREHTLALAERAAEMPRYGLALLVRALSAVTVRTDARVAALVAQLGAAIVGDRAQALVPESRSNDLRRYFSSDARTTAIVTDALLELEPTHPDVPRLVQGLLKARRRGTWYTTQENLFALVALANYVKARAHTDKAAVRVERSGDPPLLEVALDGNGAARIRRIVLPYDAADTRPLMITATRGTVHYQARAFYRRAPEAQAPRSEGFSLERSFHEPETGAPITEIPAGRMVKVRLFVSASTERLNVALTDWLPAGFEAINTRFATTAQDLPPQTPEWDERFWENHRELHDDRVSSFSNWMLGGRRRFEYLVRATTVGTFVVPAATVEEMYDPDVRARTKTTTFTVLSR